MSHPRWKVLWAVAMAVTFVVGALYVGSNLPPRPGVFRLLPSVSSETPAESTRKANDARRAMMLRGLALWALAGVALYGIGAATHGPAAD